jgi:hypothetical protein
MQLTEKVQIKETQFPKSNIKAEEWLKLLVDECLNMLNNAGIDTKQHTGAGVEIHISDTRGRKRVTNNQKGSHALGLCYAKSSSTGNKRVIEVDRETDDLWETIDTVAHEVTHAVLDENEGHKGRFPKLVKDLFKLGGKPTSTRPTEEMKELFYDFLVANGGYPHIAFRPRHRKQTTRMVKVWCTDFTCVGGTEKSMLQGIGFIFRASSKAIQNAVDAGRSLTCPVCMATATFEEDTVPEGLYA